MVEEVQSCIQYVLSICPQLNRHIYDHWEGEARKEIEYGSREEKEDSYHVVGIVWLY